MAWDTSTSLGVMQNLITVPLVAVIILSYISFKAVYNFFLHPLAKFPGPLANRITNIPYCFSILGGYQPFYILDLHERYGPVVRTAPNELSFSSSDSYRDIYGSGHSPGLPKAPFYDNFVIGLTSILTERNVAKHRHMRSQIAPAFSDRALKNQEPLIAGVIDKFIDRVGAFDNQPVDLVKWFNLIAFEVMSELAFGNSFGGLEAGVVHPWVANVQNSLRAGFLVDVVSRSLLVGLFVISRHFIWLIELVRGVFQNKQYASDVIDQRLKRGNDRDDFITTMMEGKKDIDQKMSVEQLKAHWVDMINAGSDTTATPLMTCIWFIRNDRKLYEALQGEIRNMFSTYKDIDNASTSRLRLLPAVVSEALRMYHPTPIGFPRLTGKSGAMLAGHFVPEGIVVSTHSFAASMSTANFAEPWKFRPERWFKDDEMPCNSDKGRDSEGDDLAACKPFLTGSRTCLGRSLALLEIRTVLAKMIYRYDIELVEEQCAKDWLADSKAYLFWTKPGLVVQLKPSGL